MPTTSIHKKKIYNKMKTALLYSFHTVTDRTTMQNKYFDLFLPQCRRTYYMHDMMNQT